MVSGLLSVSFDQFAIDTPYSILFHSIAYQLTLLHLSPFHVR